MPAQAEKPPTTHGATTHFGFREVAEADKAPMVRQVFDSVAPRYDLMNDLMSAGVHRLWKSTLIAAIAPRPGELLLDVAGGTGDIATRYLDALDRAGDPAAAAQDARAIVCDINGEMLDVGRDRTIDGGRLKGVAWVAGDAEHLPVASSSIDVYTIAFGLRNVTHIDAALAEARRVLRPGGRFFCLEFSRVVLPLLDKLYDLYSFQVLPRLGQWVTGDRDAYQYLVESIRKFPSQDQLARQVSDAGLERVRVRNLSGGVAAIHSAWRL
ncbi:MAG TPA: class I SAM-dependent methyltransferase [Alphaproteobacteria bacterium]|nr:class I SAM-dependent methyltransferase [Alphaproteobacteria bacterium]